VSVEHSTAAQQASQQLMHIRGHRRHSVSSMHIPDKKSVWRKRGSECTRRRRHLYVINVKNRTQHARITPEQGQKHCKLKCANILHNKYKNSPRQCCNAHAREGMRSTCILTHLPSRLCDATEGSGKCVEEERK
jgi:hypothetical protein